jgi:hypothetical protein
MRDVGFEWRTLGKPFPLYTGCGRDPRRVRVDGCWKNRDDAWGLGFSGTSGSMRPRALASEQAGELGRGTGAGTWRRLDERGCARLGARRARVGRGAERWGRRPGGWASGAGRSRAGGGAGRAAR